LRNFLTHSLYYLLYGNFFVAAAAASLTYVNAQLIGCTDSFSILPSFVFFATLFAYNFQRLIRVNNKNTTVSSFRLQWIKKHTKELRLLNVLSVIAMILIGIQLPYKTLFILVPAGIISSWYVLSYKQIPALRSIPFIKVFTIGLIWSTITVGLPYFTVPQTEINLTYFTFTVALFVIFQTIPFDIRDREIDQKSGIKTIAQKIGLVNSKRLIMVGFILMFVILFFGIRYQLLPKVGIVYAHASLVALPICFRINKNSSEIYYSLVVESILFLPFIFYVIR
tara:strand:- start:1491 stop:2333 length:843 start_codon:yes stop_codon:yes gene_type:complete